MRVSGGFVGMVVPERLESSGVLNGQTAARDKVRYQIGIQCAPVLVAIKTANMLSIPQAYLCYVLEVLQDTGVTVVKLYESKKNGKCVLLLYRQELLSIQLRKKEVLQFLRTFGYTGKMGFQQIIYWLVKRFHEYENCNGEFPHEVGIFLEYPLDDMRSFILNKGKNCLMTGYWKVYHNAGYAREVFDKYDMAKKIVIGCLSDDLRFPQIVPVYHSLYQRSIQNFHRKMS